MKVNIEVIKDPNGRIGKLVSALGRDERKQLNDAASAVLWADVRAHLRNYANAHHGSAQRLNAQPTGHLEKAAATMQHDSDADSATVTINSPGIARVFKKLTIRPTRARALTIPINAIAYGKRVGELNRVYQIYRPKGTDVLAATIDGTMTPLYALKKMVKVPQDRKILPSDASMNKSAKTGYAMMIKSIIQKTTA